MALKEFLGLTPVSEKKKEIDMAKYGLGNVVISAMSSQQYSEYQEQCMSNISKEGARFNVGKLDIIIVANHVEGLSDAELLKNSGVMSAEGFVAKMFNAGSVTELSKHIYALSGFERNINNEVKKAKN
jgi:hypothetical protein